MITHDDDIVSTENDHTPVIMFVDDEQSILNAVKRLLARKPYEVLLYESPREALAWLEHNELDVIISDMRMPEMSGVEFLEQAAIIQPEAYRIVLTGYADLKSMIEVVNRAQINGYLQKPWDTQGFIDAIEKGIGYRRVLRENLLLQQQIRDQNAMLENQVNRRTASLRKALSELEISHAASYLVLFNCLVENPYIDGNFAMRVAAVCRALAQELGCEEKDVEFIGLAGLLCELGFLGLSPVLCKTPLRQMTSDQKREFYDQVHTIDRILMPSQYLHSVTEILVNQFRRFDSIEDLEAEPMPFGACILAVVRDYLWMIEGRYYAQKLAPDNALRMIESKRGKRYHEAVVDLVVSKPSLLTLNPFASGMRLDALKSGMVLKDDLMTKSHTLLLPKGYQLTAKTIRRLFQYEENMGEVLQVSVLLPNDEMS